MRSWKRQLHLLHRWLGIAIGLLVLLWFGSGVVMMYVPYPALTEQERMEWLAPLDAGQIRLGAWDAWRVTAIRGVPGAVRLNSVAGRPVYHFMAEGRWNSVWADTGAMMRVDYVVAKAAAHSMVAGAPALTIEPVEADQWTFGRLNAHWPLSRITMDDAAGSVAYVSGRTGELVRDTTRGERAWNWAGSVIHWIYFTPLRTHGEPWRQVVMWTSAVALLLAMLGMVLGIQRLRLKRRYSGGRSSPYRGWQAWHHWLGLTLGTLTLTWLFSGWLSVTPFGWLSSPGITAQDRLAFAGGALDRDDLSVATADILRLRAGVLELEWRRVGGKLYLSVLDRAGRRLVDGRSGALAFASVVRARPVWDVMVVSLCLLGAMLATTGLVLGWRRLNKYK